MGKVIHFPPRLRTAGVKKPEQQAKVSKICTHCDGRGWINASDGFDKPLFGSYVPYACPVCKGKKYVNEESLKRAKDILREHAIAVSHEGVKTFLPDDDPRHRLHKALRAMKKFGASREERARQVAFYKKIKDIS